MALKSLSLAFAFLLPVAAPGFVYAAGPMGATEGRIVTAQRWNLWNDPQGDLVKPEGVKEPPAAKSSGVKPKTGDAGGKESERTAAGPDYVIGAGDVLDISVWKDEALTKSVIVLPDGQITFPLIGKVEAAGKKVSQLKEEMESKLARYVTDLVLSVEVKQINSMTIYVIGRVNAPGRFALNGNVSVLQALAIAGGFTPFANRDKVKIFRQDGGKTKVLPFRYSDVADGKKLEENIMLHRGDVIVVP
jgi:polysaccharide export outer membrane protein